MLSNEQFCRCLQISVVRFNQNIRIKRKSQNRFIVTRCCLLVREIEIYYDSLCYALPIDRSRRFWRCVYANSTFYE